MTQASAITVTGNDFGPRYELHPSIEIAHHYFTAQGRELTGLGNNKSCTHKSTDILKEEPRE